MDVLTEWLPTILLLWEINFHTHD